MPIIQEQNSFVYTLDDDRHAGHADYRDRADTRERIFFHTEIGEEFAGQGLASALVDAAFEKTFDEGYNIVAVCPYVKARLEKYPEKFAGTWRKPVPGDLSWLERHM